MKELQPSEFDSLSALPVALVDFFGDNCTPCKNMLPVLALVEEKRPDVSFFKINVAADYALAGRMGIQALPTFLLMERGVVKSQRTGSMTPADMLRWMGEVL